MHHFVQYLSHTCSIAILTLIAVERYLAIIHPLRSKRIITPSRLKRSVAAVWLGSAIYSCPRLFMYGTVTFPLPDGQEETICHLRRQLYNSRLYDTANFLICFALPLVTISVMYAKISHALWRSGRQQWSSYTPYPRHNDGEVDKTSLEMIHLASSGSSAEEPISYSMLGSATQDGSSVTGHHRRATLNGATSIPVSVVTHVSDSDPEEIADETMMVEPTIVAPPPQVKTAGLSNVHLFPTGRRQCDVTEQRRQREQACGPAAKILQARRKVVRLLVAVVLSFTVCNLPFHARKMYQYWSPHYDATSNSAMMATPITFLLVFLNSGMNPILYAFLSDNFRRGMRDVLTCHFRQRPKRCRSYSHSRSVTTSHVSINKGNQQRLSRQSSVPQPSPLEGAVSSISLLNNGASELLRRS